MQMLRIAVWCRDHSVAESVLATNDVQGALAQLFLKNGFKVESCDLTSRFYLFEAIPQLLRIISIHKIDIIQAHLFRESIVCRLTKLFRPNIIHLFRVETYIDCSPIAGIKKSLYHLLARLTDFLVSWYIANGVLVATELKSRSKIPSDKIKEVYNGVESFGVPDLEDVQLDEKGFLRIVMVANFIKGKGHELLIDAVAQLKGRGILIKAFLIGSDMDHAGSDGKTYSDEIKDLVNDSNLHDHFVFCGFSSNLREDLKQFRILVLPSHSEATPNTVLEAMSVRKLVITSNVGELTEMIQHGVSGLIHTSGNAHELVTLLGEVINIDKEKLNLMRDRGYERWKTLFSLDSMMHEISKYYLSKKSDQQ